MSPRPKPAASARTPPIPDDSPSEHIYIGGDEFSTEPGVAARTVRGTRKLENTVRRRGVEVTLFEEGFIKVIELNGKNAATPFLLDLRFVDPVPRIERVFAARSFLIALGCAATAGLAGFLLRFDALYIFAAPALGAAVLGAAVALYFGIYRSYETTEFRTLHGRVPVLKLLANFGSIKRYRAFVPLLSEAIEEAAERIGDDTSAYLRAEMREHYRLRGDGVLDNDTCAAGTGRILAQFDVQL
jgi:hypothetical protein